MSQCDTYFQPLPARTGLPLAGGSLRFAEALCLRRGQEPETIAAERVPPAILDQLTQKRATIPGCDPMRPALMGILNATPDSFSDGGRYNDPAMALEQGQRMIAEGASLLDIGGESTRPGAEPVTPEAECARVLPVIEGLSGAAHLSIDTRNSATAKAALAAGAVLFNDVSALSHDPKSAQIAAQSGAFVCLMHAQGSPQTMQADPRYDHVLLDVYDALAQRIAAAEAAGIARARIIVDPGIGFGKTHAHNMRLMRGLALFHGLGCPILLGASRKRFIGTLTGEADAAQRGPGSVGAALFAAAQGVQILRVHDVAMTRAALDVFWPLQVGME